MMSHMIRAGWETKIKWFQHHKRKKEAKPLKRMVQQVKQKEAKLECYLLLSWSVPYCSV
uniref:Uncharacterized protein n=1 Tax=Arundo donax TaxID=35708 RepID=A0A0A9GFP4_ARUDO